MSVITTRTRRSSGSLSGAAANLAAATTAARLFWGPHAGRPLRSAAGSRNFAGAKELRHDRLVLLADAERQEGDDPPRGTRPALHGHSVQHWQGRPVHGRFSQ